MRPALLLALFSLLLVAPADAKPHHKPCARKGTNTVKATKLVRVFERANHEGGNDLIGCLRSTDKARILASSYDDGFVTSGAYDHLRIAGRYVAWQFTATDISCKADCPPGYDSTTTNLYVHDLRKGKTAGVAGEIASGGRLVLTRGGAIAWSEDDPLVIRAFDAAGARDLDTGDGIAPGSLALHDGNLATWTNAGQQRSARLKRRG